ncbi:LamG-like jellyroll fold domain-containing protein [Haloterrigena salinisoli]|uniref:LamG-like jellyroll fold domain-containing protein n=1 Tax=Haloterrigena salinisoli TaxID=3132747 RepID=UPI0030CB97E3
MSEDDSFERVGENQSPSSDLTLTRRNAMSLLGIGGLAGSAAGSSSASHSSGSGKAARDADVIVWKDDEGVYHADSADGHVASSEDFIGVTQAAVDSLTDDRDWKEKVVIASPGEVTQTDGTGIEIPSYTIFDVPAPINLPEDSSLTLVEASDAEHIEIPNFTLHGPADYGILLHSVTDVVLGNIRLHMPTGEGVRIDNESDSEDRSTDIQVDRVYGVGTDYHLFETAAVDRIQINQVLAKNVGGCAVLLNDSSDATIGDIIEYSPDIPDDWKYATFRTTFQDGRVTADNIVSHQAGRGLHIHRGSGEIVINNVYIEGARNKGAVINAPPNTILNGGIIKNCQGEAVDLYSTTDPKLTPERRAEGVKITNMRIYDDRPEGERTQTEAIDEGGNALNNQFVDNDLRDGGTDAIINTASPTTVVRDNVGAGVAQGMVTLSSGSDPAARVESVDDHPDVTLDLRSKTFEGPSSAFQYDHHFEWTGGQWDLVFEWVTDPGESLTVDYIVDRPQANIGRYPQDPGKDYVSDIGTEDVPATDLPVTDGLKMHLDATTLDYLSDGDTIETWPDRSEAGNYAYQDSAENRPTYSPDAMNGDPVVQFSHTDETRLALYDEMATVGSTTFIAVGQFTGGLDNGEYIVGQDKGLGVEGARYRIANYGNWDGTDEFTWRVGTGNVEFGTPDTEPHVFVEDSSMNVYLDGEKAPDMKEENTATDKYPTDLSLGSKGRGRGFWDGNLAEVLVFDRELSEDEISQIHQYLANKYDSVSLS